MAFIHLDGPCYRLIFRTQDQWPGIGMESFVTEPSSEPEGLWPFKNYDEDDQGVFVDGQFFTYQQLCG